MGVWIWLPPSALFLPLVESANALVGITVPAPRATKLAVRTTARAVP
jgi:hypothetical protein